MRFNKWIFSFVALILVALSIIVLMSCKKCYVCKAMKEGYDQAEDFEKSCGSSDENKKMEESFRQRYPESQGYRVTCQ